MKLETYNKFLFVLIIEKLFIRWNHHNRMNFENKIMIGIKNQMTSWYEIFEKIVFTVIISNTNCTNNNEKFGMAVYTEAKRAAN